MGKFDLDRVHVNHAVKTAVKELAQLYTFDRLCEKGSNGYVFFGQDNVLHRRVAVKFYYWGGERKYHIEPQALAAVESSHVARVYHAGLADKEWAFFVMPEFPGGDLDDLCSGEFPSFHKSLDLTAGVLEGLNFLHALQFVHRDIKPENVFVDAEVGAIIGDFGSVRKTLRAGDTVPGSGLTILFSPPETLSDGLYRTAGDLYQAGLLLFRLLGGYLPYDGTAWMTSRELSRYRAISDGFDRDQFINHILRAKITRGRLVDTSTLPPWVPQQARRLVRQATNVEPHRRFESTTEFLAALQRLRRTLPEWTIERDGFEMRSDGVRRLIRGNADTTCDVLRPRGEGWQRDNAVQCGSAAEVCDALNRTYSK